MRLSSTTLIFMMTLLCFALPTMVGAAPISTSATAPTVDGADISMLDMTGAYDIGGNQGHIWNNRPAQGQTITTGSDPNGYLLTGVTLQSRQTNSHGGVFRVRVGAVGSDTFMHVGNEDFTKTSYNTNDYLTSTFATPIPLNPNTTYGFDWGSDTGGFVTNNNVDTGYAGGSAYSSGTNGSGGNIATIHSGTGGGTGDRIFHADLTARATAPTRKLLPIFGIAGHENGDSATGDGSIYTAISGVGLTKPDLEDPSTWTHTNSWQSDWQGNFTGGSPQNANQGWAVIDLGSEQEALENLYLWNVNEANALDRGVEDFNIYYATDPTVTPPDATDTPQTYDFASGGWTQLGDTETLLQGTADGALPVSGIFDISGASGAQFLGIDILSNYGSTFRVGLAEIAVTAPTTLPAVPEPSTFMLGALGLLGFVAYARRRKR